MICCNISWKKGTKTAMLSFLCSLTCSPASLRFVEESWGRFRTPKSDCSIPAMDANWPNLQMTIYVLDVASYSTDSDMTRYHNMLMWTQSWLANPASLSRSRKAWNLWKEASMLSSTCSSSITEWLAWASERDWFTLRKRKFSNSS